jgi:hypothetical protein
MPMKMVYLKILAADHARVDVDMGEGNGAELFEVKVEDTPYKFRILEASDHSGK